MHLYRLAWSCLWPVIFISIEGPTSEVRGAQQAAGVTRLSPLHSTSKNTKFVSCFGKGKPTGSYTVRSPILTSPDGLHRAYVEVEATAFRPKGEPADNEPSFAPVRDTYYNEGATS